MCLSNQAVELCSWWIGTYTEALEGFTYFGLYYLYRVFLLFFNSDNLSANGDIFLLI